MSFNLRALQGILIAGEQGRDDVLSGKKQITIRQGYRDYSNGPTLIGCHILNWATLKQITSVHYALFKNITLKELQDDGFQNHDEALDRLHRWYPDLTIDSEMTIIRWED